MDGRWQDAPDALLRSIAKFEKYAGFRFIPRAVRLFTSDVILVRTLETIHEHLKKEAEHKWHNRLMRKNAIETALVEHNLMIDDAARSFQVGLLLA